MAIAPHIPLRDARDRLLDLLGIGRTYPLRDLAVRDEQLTVAFNTTAKIPIENSQQGVLYQLHHNKQPVKRTATREGGAGSIIGAEGDGGAILLETNKIEEDITFEVYARKPAAGPKKYYRETYLHQTATVKVGLDTKLPARILDAPFLEPAMENLAVDSPRLVNYGAEVEVEIQNSQEEVDYRLVYFRISERRQREQEVPLSVMDKRGNLENLVLRTKPVAEDIDIRIRATKTFDPSEGRETQTALLDIVLPLKVRANPALPMTFVSGPIIDYNVPAAIKIGSTQASTQYQAFIRTILDRDFVRQPDSDVVKVPVAGEEDVQIRKPAGGEVWATPEGYVALGDAPQVGTDGELQFNLPALTDDCLVIIQAQKTHVAQAATEEQPARLVSSALQLAQVAAILVRPDQAPPLRLKVWMVGAATNGDLQVLDGQPGVFYSFRLDPDGADIGLPAYFHKRDDRDDRINKGLEQLAVEVDYVIARPRPLTSANPNLAEVPPEPPLLATGPLPGDAILHIRAVKAQTCVATPLAQPIQIPAGPEVTPEDSVVNHGAKTKIRIRASQAKELYQVLQDGEPLGDPVKGTGRDRLIETGELKQDATFELLVRQPDAPIAVERVLRLAVMVRPDTTLLVSATEPVVDTNTATQIVVAASQFAVHYQLLVGEEPLGEPAEGNGANVALSSGPLAKDTTFVIRATRVAHPDVFVMLAQQVTVQVRPETDGAA